MLSIKIFITGYSEAPVMYAGQCQCMAVTQRTRAILVHFNHSEQRLAWSNGRVITDNTVRYVDPEIEPKKF